MSKRYMLFFALLIAQCCLANNPIEIPRLESVIEFDGIPNEPFWEQAKVLPLIMQVPNYGKTPSEKSDILIGNTDWFGLVIDSYYDLEMLMLPKSNDRAIVLKYTYTFRI